MPVASGSNKKRFIGITLDSQTEDGQTELERLRAENAKLRAQVKAEPNDEKPDLKKVKREGESKPKGKMEVIELD